MHWLRAENCHTVNSESKYLGDYAKFHHLTYWDHVLPCWILFYPFWRYCFCSTPQGTQQCLGDIKKRKNFRMRKLTQHAYVINVIVHQLSINTTIFLQLFSYISIWFWFSPQTSKSSVLHYTSTIKRYQK